MLRKKIGPLQGADRFKASEYAYNTVIFAGIGDGVDVGAGANRGQIGVSSLPACQGIAYSVGSNRQSSRTALGGKPCAGLEVSGRENDTSDDGWLGRGDLRELVDFRLQSLLIDFEIHVKLVSTRRQRMSVPILVDQILGRHFPYGTEPLRTPWAHPD